MLTCGVNKRVEPQYFFIKVRSAYFIYSNSLWMDKRKYKKCATKPVWTLHSYYMTNLNYPLKLYNITLVSNQIGRPFHFAIHWVPKGGILCPKLAKEMLAVLFDWNLQSYCRQINNNWFCYFHNKTITWKLILINNYWKSNIINRAKIVSWCVEITNLVVF